jgi:hypothetical protein
MLSDTHPRMEKLQFDLLRDLPAWRKWAIVDDLSATVRGLALAGLKLRHPGASPEMIRRLYAVMLLGDELARKVLDHADRVGAGGNAGRPGA